MTDRDKEPAGLKAKTGGMEANCNLRVKTVFVVKGRQLGDDLISLPLITSPLANFKVTSRF
jgi:hypothetical protein